MKTKKKYLRIRRVKQNVASLMYYKYELAHFSKNTLIYTSGYKLLRRQGCIFNTSLRQGLVTEVWQHRKHQN